MDVALIPVIEIWGNSEGITSPNDGSYKESPKEWDLYNLKCLENAGFDISGMRSYEGKSYLYTAYCCIYIYV